MIKAPRSLSFAASDRQAAEELKGSLVAERLMRADGVVDAFPGTGLAIDGVDGPSGERGVPSHKLIHADFIGGF
jgi:hypothetical protein